MPKLLLEDDAVNASPVIDPVVATVATDDSIDGRVEELEDYSLRVRLFAERKSEDEYYAILRDMTGADLKFFEKAKGDNIEKTIALVARLCTKWGDRPGVTIPELEKVRAKNLMLLGQVVTRFLYSESTELG